MYLSCKMTWIFRKVFTAFRLGIEKWLCFLSVHSSSSSLSFPFLLIRLYSFRAVLGSQQSWRDGTEISHIFSVPAYPPPSLSASPPEWGHLLQLINPHWHLIITQSPLWLIGNSMDFALCCPFCGFRHTHNDMYPSLWYFFFFSLSTFNTYQKFMQYLLKT